MERNFSYCMSRMLKHPVTFCQRRFIISGQRSCLKSKIYLKTNSSNRAFHTNSSFLQQMNKNEDIYDIIIAGGGMVGTAMACALGNAVHLTDKRILMLDMGSPEMLTEVPLKYSNRVSAINPSSKNLFTKFGAWDYISKLRVQPVKKMQIWESCSDAMITFDRNRMEEEVAYIIENSVILSGLLHSIQNLENGIHLIHKAKIKKYILPEGSIEGYKPLVQVCLEDGRMFQTRLLIGADGPQSLVRKSLDAKYLEWSYDQKAIVATLQLAEPTENIVAWQKFITTGPIALLPLNNNLSSLVWSTTVEEAEKLMEMPQENFVDALNNALWNERKRIRIVDDSTTALQKFLQVYCSVPSSGYQLPPSIQSAEDRAAFPLGLGHSAQYVGSRVALIGDAAHKVHPMAGLGVNLGFGDVQELVNILDEAVYQGEEIGNLSHLLEYETRRQMHIMPIMATIDGLKRLYSTDIVPVVLVRSLGLQLTHAFNPVKKMLMEYASR